MINEKMRNCMTIDGRVDKRGGRRKGAEGTRREVEIIRSSSCRKVIGSRGVGQGSLHLF